MTIALSTAATRLAANAANVATQMGGGTTAAEVTALAAMLTVLSLHNDLAFPAIKIANDKNVTNG